MASRSEATRLRTDPRISRRRKAVARSKRKRIAGAILACALVAVSVWAAFSSPLLAVRRVQVVGAAQTNPDDVREVVGLGHDDNLLLVSTSRIAAAAEQLPWVARAEVHRRLPGTVRIKIFEHHAALVVVLATGRWTVDASGRVLESGAAADLPTLTGAPLGTLEVGEQVTSQEIATGLTVWRSLPGRIRSQVSSVVAASPERVALVLRDGTQVRYGGADHLASKNKVLAALMTRVKAQGRRPSYIDVSVPINPAVGPALTRAPSPTPTG